VVPSAFEYQAPSSVAEAVALLSARPGEAKVIAGGQSLIPMMRFRLAAPTLLVDIGRIAGLDVLAEEDGYLRIGAGVRHADLERASWLAARYPLLASTARVVADPIVRNRGTVCGSLAHADPAGDWGAALIAARAEAVIEGPAGRRALALDAFLVDTFTTALAEDEILVEVRVPAPAGHVGGDYQKIERKVGDFATAAVAAQVEFAADGAVVRAGIGLCNAGAISVRASAAERALVGRPLAPDTIAAAAEAAAATADPAADSRGSAAYKKDMFRVLTARALTRAAGATDAPGGQPSLGPVGR
jgi:carbon-monoxide dehydrogenase medium subunit